MNKRTINQAITETLKRKGEPLRAKEVYNRIIKDDLYRFRAVDLEHIVRTLLRRHCENLEFPSASSKKYFTQLNDGRYWIKNLPSKELDVAIKKKLTGITSAYIELKSLHEKYIQSFKQSVLQQLKELDPTSFEEFCKELIKAYCFKNVKITQSTRDGGIDGYGELKIGLAFMKVAFECKRWKTNSVGRPKISQFRGDIQGKFQQGIYFTTSKFSKEAKEASFQPGAVPIILIDGSAIVVIMIEKKFGIEVEELPIFTNALDLILNDNN